MAARYYKGKSVPSPHQSTSGISCTSLQIRLSMHLTVYFAVPSPHQFDKKNLKSASHAPHEMCGTVGDSIGLAQSDFKKCS